MSRDNKSRKDYLPENIKPGSDIADHFSVLARRAHCLLHQGINLQTLNPKKVERESLKIDLRPGPFISSSLPGHLSSCLFSLLPRHPQDRSSMQSSGKSIVNNTSLLQALDCSNSLVLISLKSDHLEDAAWFIAKLSIPLT